MRISDWSSDVCSSDLLDLGRRIALRIGRDLHIDALANVFAGGDGGALSGLIIAGKYANAVHPDGAPPLVERIARAAPAAAQRGGGGGKLERLGGGPIGDRGAGEKRGQQIGGAWWGERVGGKGRERG